MYRPGRFRLNFFWDHLSRKSGLGIGSFCAELSHDCRQNWFDIQQYYFPATKSYKTGYHPDGILNLQRIATPTFHNISVPLLWNSLNCILTGRQSIFSRYFQRRQTAFLMRSHNLRDSFCSKSEFFIPAIVPKWSPGSLRRPESIWLDASVTKCEIRTQDQNAESRSKAWIKPIWSVLFQKRFRLSNLRSNLWLSGTRSAFIRSFQIMVLVRMYGQGPGMDDTTR
jgi:hypothetical protein